MWNLEINVTHCNEMIYIVILFCYCCSINLHCTFCLLPTAPSSGDTPKQPFYGELSAMSALHLQ